MDILTPFLSEQTVRQIGWVLVHFLWQGCVIMALMWLVLKLHGKASSNTRYLTACFGLVLMISAPVVTFILINSNHPAAILETTSTQIPASFNLQPPAETQDYVIAYAEPAVPEKNLKQTFTAHLEAALPYCVIGWLAGVSALSLWYLGGWCRLQRLRRIGTKTVPRAITETTSQLAHRLGIHKAIHIAESALVQVPTVIGWLKPVILLPATALTGLDELQLQAMLAHELAHIKRYDYLVNIAQTIVEILGFYHPVVWWMSRQIRIEREICCDDIAVGLLQNRKEYAKALFSMEAIRAKQHDLAVAANGAPLTDRIRRITGKENLNPNSGWIPVAVTFALIITLVSGIAFTAQRPDLNDKGFAGIEEQLSGPAPSSAAPADPNVSDNRIEAARMESMNHLRQLGLAYFIFMDEHDNTPPANFEDLKSHLDAEGYQWIAENVVLLETPKALTSVETMSTPIAYDKTLLDTETQNGTTVAYADGHVEFKTRESFDKNIQTTPDTDASWEEKFYRLYRLDEGQILKRIAPPYIPQRKDYYYANDSDQAKLIPEPPDYFTFHWDGQLQSWGMGFMSGTNTLDNVIRQCLSIPPDRFEGPDWLLNMPVPGDWIVRKDASDAARLHALESILQEEFGRNITFEKRRVIIAKGTYRFTPPSGTYNDRYVHFYSDALDANEGSGGGTADTVAELIAVLGKRTGISVVDETTNGSQVIHQPYGHHRSSRLRNIDDETQRDLLNQMLRNLEKQTNLTFTVEERPVEKWFVTEGNQIPTDGGGFDALFFNLIIFIL